LVKVLARQPGTKESRYMHLMSGDMEVAPVEDAREHVRGSSAAESLDRERIEQLEAEVAALKNEIAELRQQFAQFRKQFE
jgi:uncharacterized protein YceH (UPF0502 family)